MQYQVLRLRGAAACLTAGFVLNACGGGNNITPPPPPLTPTPTAVPTEVPCNLPAGPVTRYAVAARFLQTLPGPIDVPLLVRIDKAFTDEVVCLDKNLSYRLSFDSKQRNAANQECCWENEPVWNVVADPDNIVSNDSPWGAAGFQYRMRVDPGGKDTFFLVAANLDGIDSFAWQSGSFYEVEPVRVETMSGADMARRCKCVYEGNGIYSGAGCPK